MSTHRTPLTVCLAGASLAFASCVPSSDTDAGTGASDTANPSCYVALLDTARTYLEEQLGDGVEFYDFTDELGTVDPSLHKATVSLTDRGESFLIRPGVDADFEAEYYVVYLQDACRENIAGYFVANEVQIDTGATNGARDLLVKRNQACATDYARYQFDGAVYVETGSNRVEQPGCTP